jgi:hypothetical protein
MIEELEVTRDRSWIVCQYAGQGEWMAVGDIEVWISVVGLSKYVHEEGVGGGFGQYQARLRRCTRSGWCGARDVDLDGLAWKRGLKFERELTLLASTSSVATPSPGTPAHIIAAIK